MKNLISISSSFLIVILYVFLLFSANSVSIEYFLLVVWFPFVLFLASSIFYFLSRGVFYFWLSISLLGLSSILALSYAINSTYLASRISPVRSLYANGQIWLLSGDIDKDTLTQWIEASQKDSNGPVILVLNSRGGNTDVALQLADRIKARGGITAVVEANAVCQSACTLLFAAASTRIADPAACFMFHASWIPVRLPFMRAFYKLPSIREDKMALALTEVGHLGKTLTELGAFQSIDPGIYLTGSELYAKTPAFLTLKELPVYNPGSYLFRAMPALECKPE